MFHISLSHPVFYQFRELEATTAAIPAQSEKNTAHLAGHLRKKYRTFDRTSEAYFATPIVRHYCISAVF